MIDRREFISTAAIAAIAGGTVAISSPLSLAGEVGRGSGRERVLDASSPTKIIDTNISLFQWPFRRLPLDETRLLVDKLRALGIKQAWAGSFEGVFHRDITSVNERLALACRTDDELVPIGSINPALPDWEKDLELCANRHRMPGVRIHPNYHGYKLDDTRCVRLIQRATLAGQFVQIAAMMEDTRTQHPLVQVPGVDLARLPILIQQCPGAKVQILNGRPSGQLLDQLAKARGVFFGVSRVDGTDGISKLLDAVSSERVLFGSHAPFLIPEAALIRVDESDIGAEQRRAVMWTNAQQLVSSAGESKAEHS
jgi:hypothetical protein